MESAADVHTTDHTTPAFGQVISTRWERLDARLTPRTVALAAALISLALGIYQVTRPNVLLGEPGANLDYDQGVYFGVATRLAHGVLPYRDFVFVHPPGIAVLMLPIALLGRVIGSGSSLGVAQCLTVVVVATNVFLAGYLVRSAGRIAVFIASALLAIWPFTVQVNGLVMLEPYLVLFTLLGGVLLCRGTAAASQRRILMAGLCLGMALSVKMWGALPIVAAVIWCLPAWRRRLVPLLAGVATVLVVVWAPFVIAASGAFAHDVIGAQLSRKPFIGIPLTPLSAQLKTVIGFSDIFGGPIITDSLMLMTLAYAVLAALVAVVFGLKWRARSAADWLVLLLGVTAFVGMIAMPTPNYSTHYAYFPAALVAPVIGICVGRAPTWIGRHTRGNSLGSLPLPAALGVAGAVVGVLAIALFVPKVTGAIDLQVSTAYDPRPAVQGAIPQGACVIGDYPLSLLLSDRFSSSKPGCPVVVDPFGMYLTDDDGNQPHVSTPANPLSPTFTNKWAAWLPRADYVVMTVPFSDYIPWSQALMQTFNQTFVRVAWAQYTNPPHAGGSVFANLYIYRRITG
jgi:alpha-1,2-mannosyltransferase